jgi:hypothetical protein
MRPPSPSVEQQPTTTTTSTTASRLPSAVASLDYPPLDWKHYTKSAAEQARLLALYETGMPSWAVFFPRFGLPYRRSFRVAVVTLLNIWPLIALIVGLYDLYKHIPHMAEWLGAAFVEWMESHLTLRASLVVAYAFTSSLRALESILALVKNVVALMTIVLSPLKPIYHLLSLVAWVVKGPLIMLLQIVMALVTGPLSVIWSLVTAVFAPAIQATTVVSSAAAPTSTIARNLARIGGLWSTVLRPVKNLLKAYYDGIVFISTAVARRELSIRQWYLKQVARWYALMVRFWKAVWSLWRSMRLSQKIGCLVAVVGVVTGLCVSFGWFIGSS